MRSNDISGVRGRRGAIAEIPSEVAGRLIGTRVKAGAEAYDRERDLPALIRLDPWTQVSETPDGVKAIISRLERALRAERNRARSGHWTYDLNRHIALRQAHVAETERLMAIEA